MDFKAGDIVQLKSGGPVMTVAHVSGDSVLCIWIEKNKTFREPFPPVVLEKRESFSDF
ncbi:MAG: DUF2158 domain-containing protein [Sphingopyxis sp.]|nr:DUF2158 domain-containing protein [Sphingopyxis sp.]